MLASELRALLARTPDSTPVVVTVEPEEYVELTAELTGGLLIIAAPGQEA